MGGFLLISKNFYQNVNKKTYKNKKKCDKLNKERENIAEFEIGDNYAGH